jgi:hypothetical protein
MLESTPEKRIPSTWNIHYPRWIIDDGEPEREVGEDFPWSVLAYHSSEQMTCNDTRELSVLEADDYGYDVVAEIVHVSPTAAVIDFGLTAFGQRDLVPRECKVGDYVAGRIRLSFVHYCDPAVPDQIRESMSHQWSTEDILADLTPHIPGRESAARFIRDLHNIQYERVKSTREKKAWSYVLFCCLRHSL